MLVHEKIEKFLHIPRILRDKYQINESFNLFKVLRSSSDEVRLHSRFLAELLDPRGSHGLGSVFLNHFVRETLSIKSFNCDTAFVLKEWNDIDILIRNQSGQAIIIENKIYAHDQNNQLNRYFNIVNDLKFKSENIVIAYLTLDGRKASEQSISGIPDAILKSNYTNISYKIDIVNWLKLCRKESVEKPELRESISQYLSLVAELTHTNQSTKFMKELESWFGKELISGQPVEIIDALTVAKNNFHAKQIDLLRQSIYSMITDVAKNEDESTSELSDCENFIAKNDSFEIWVRPLSESDKLQIGFICNHGSSYITVWCSQKDDKDIYEAARNAIDNSHLSSYNRTNQSSVGWKYLSDPIILSESTDENLRKLSRQDYINSLAETIALDINNLTSILREDRTLKSLL